MNSLWPCTLIDTAAIRNLPRGETLARGARSPEIMADAAHAVLTGSNAVPAAGSRSGDFYTHEQVLAAAGVTDFAPYSPGVPRDRLVRDIFL